MNVTMRSFIVMSDGTFKAISLKKFSRFRMRQETLPSFAGQKLRIASAMVELKHSKPDFIYEISVTEWQVDANGYYDDSNTDRLVRKIGAMTVKGRGVTRPSENVVDVSGMLMKRQLDRDEPKPLAPLDKAKLTRLILKIK